MGESFVSTDYKTSFAEEWERACSQIKEATSPVPPLKGKNADDLDEQGLIRLSIAVVRQAYRDYCNSIIKLRRYHVKSEKWKQAAKDFEECRHFFKGKRVTYFTTIDGDYFLELAHKETDYKEGEFDKWNLGRY